MAALILTAALCATVTASLPWSGAVLETTNVTEAHATFKIPKLTTPKGGNSTTQYGALVWVGIDGYNNCGQGLLQTGVILNLYNGQASFQGFYEWFPDISAEFFPLSQISFSTGDEVYAQVVAHNATTGTATVKNLSTGKSASHTYVNQHTPLCMKSADWIVEDYVVNGQLEPWVNFTSISFNDAEATVKGNCVGVTGAMILNLKDKATAMLNGTEGVVVTYV